MGFFDSWKVQVHTFLKHQVVYPGNVIEGYCEISNSGNIDFVGIRVKVCGKEKVICRREEGVGEDRRTHTYTETNVVYKQLITLAGNMKSSGSRQKYTLPPGNYTYPFAFQLPVDIPPSFSKRASDDRADLMYYIKAYVDIPMGRDAVHKSYFTVLKPLPISQWQHAQPVSVDRFFHVTFCCCIDKGNVRAQLYMDRTVIAIDRDNLVVTADVDNTQGQNPVESVEVSLVNLLKYRARHVTETNRVVAGREFIRQGVAPGQRGRIQGVIPLPRNAVPSMQTFNCSSEYTVNIELNIPWASDPCHTFPVIVAQSVDPTNFSPPVQFGQCPYRKWGKGEYREFFYQPPPQPVYQFTPAPIGPPPSNANIYSYNEMQIQMPLPAPQWDAAIPPIGFDGPPPRTDYASIQWNSTPQDAQVQAPVQIQEMHSGMTELPREQAASGGDTNQPLLS